MLSYIDARDGILDDMMAQTCTVYSVLATSSFDWQLASSEFSTNKRSTYSTLSPTCHLIITQPTLYPFIPLYVSMSWYIFVLLLRNVTGNCAVIWQNNGNINKMCCLELFLNKRQNKHSWSCIRSFLYFINSQPFGCNAFCVVDVSRVNTNKCPWFALKILFRIFKICGTRTQTDMLIISKISWTRH